MQALKSTRVLQPHSLGPAYVVVENEKIKTVVATLPDGFRGEVVDHGDLVIAPGLVDTHVHINEPGRTEWEGFATATQAAAAGGITTLVDMPLNCIPVTTSAAALQEKLRAVSSQLFVDCGFWGGVIPTSLPDLPKLLASGVLGVKSFMIDSGIDEFPPMYREHLRQAVPLLAEAGLPYLIHAEMDQGEASSLPVGADYESFLRSRPRSWENNAIDQMIGFAREYDARIHIVHLSSSDILPTIAQAKRDGVKITVETCPHYLLFDAESIESGQTGFKCCPPIREKSNQEKLWQGLADETIDFICSDHSPCTVQLKTQYAGDFGKAWGGISSLQFTLPLIMTEATHRGYKLTDVNRWLAERPAAFAGLDRLKGRVAAGLDADFVVWDPDERWTIRREDIHYKNKMSPYEGREVKGRVHATYLRGKKIFSRAEGFLASPRGRPLLKGENV